MSRTRTALLLKKLPVKTGATGALALLALVALAPPRWPRPRSPSTRP